MNSHPYNEIKPGGKKAEKMRHMSNIRTAAKKLTSQFNQCIYEYQNRSRNRNNSPDENHRAGKKYCIGKKHRINRAACSQQKYPVLSCIPLDQKGEETAQRPANQIEKQEFPASNSLFEAQPEYKQSQHIKKNMLYILMDKHIGQKLPVHMVMLHQNRIHSTIVMNIFSEVWIQKTYTKNAEIYENNQKSISPVSIGEWPSENKSISWHLQISAQS